MSDPRGFRFDPVAEDYELGRAGWPSEVVYGVEGLAWREAGEAVRELRRRGATVPLLDVAIATAAAGSGAELWSRDRDFERVRGVVAGLRLYEAR